MLKYIFVFFAIIIVLLLLYMLAAFVFPRVAVNNERIPGNDIAIYLKSNGVHTDIVVPVKTTLFDWSSVVKFENTFGNDTTAIWVGLGWGDKGFYLQTPTWSDLTFGVAFRASTGLSTAAIHATFYKQLVENDKCIKIQISKEEYQKLTAFILEGFKRNPSGDVIHIKTDANYGSTDAFYEAIGTYSLFYTCNTWTNSALKAAGLKTGLWTAFDAGILHHYKK